VEKPNSDPSGTSPATEDAPRWAREIAPRPIEWIFPGYIPRGFITLVAGPRNQGKSLLGMHLAAETSHGSYLGSDQGTAWVNSVEDDLFSVTRPRCEVAGSDMGRVLLSSIPYRFPKDLERLADDLEKRQGAGGGIDLLVLDSLARHIPRFTNGEVAAEAMGGLKEIAEACSIGLVLIAHFTKGGASGVERAIGGAGVIQNLAKAIFVFGPRPNPRKSPIITEGTPSESDEDIRILACERMGVAPRPASIEYRIQTRILEVTDRSEPYLVRLGESSHSAEDVLAELQQHKGPTRAHEHGRMHGTAVWILDALRQEGPMPTNKLIARAKECGVFFSENTFERARRLAEVQSIRPAEIEQMLGPELYARLDEEERRLFWVRIRPFDEPPLDQWR